MIDRILLVDDEREILDLLRSHLLGMGYPSISCSSGEAAAQILDEEDLALVIADVRMSGMSGIELCGRISSSRPDLPVLLLTAFGTMDTAIEAIRAGAYDFMVKPVDFDALTRTVEKAIRGYKARRRARQLDTRRDPVEVGSRHDLLGESRAMVEVRTMVDRISGLDSTVLITGESGTGKELVSKVLHERSPRRTKPFVAVNCAAMPESAFEEALFGRSDRPRTGLVYGAQEGTLFFDGIAHLPLMLQSKLLRLLDERLYRPLGAAEESHCPARFVIATNENLDCAIRNGTFRADLFFRINVVHVKLPTLRERGNDVLFLAKHFLETFSLRMNKPIKGFSAPVIERLSAYHWPGNVRELKNAVERAVAVTKYDHILLDDMPETLRGPRVAAIPRREGGEELASMEEIEERHILGVLRELKGNKALAAKVLKLDRKTLYRKLDRYGYGD